VREKRLDQVDETKLALAVWLMARKLVVDDTEQESATPDGATPEVPEQPDEKPRADAQEAA
jgi:hypothetical protein